MSVDLGGQPVFKVRLSRGWVAVLAIFAILPVEAQAESGFTTTEATAVEQIAQIDFTINIPEFIRLSASTAALKWGGASNVNITTAPEPSSSLQVSSNAGAIVQGWRKSADDGLAIPSESSILRQTNASPLVNPAASVFVAMP